MNNLKSRIFIFELILLLLILSLAAYFRFLNNSSYPGLYNDEGTQINIALNFMQGKTEYLGIRDSLLLVMRMPLFPFLLSILFRIFSPGLEVVRGFSACLGLITIALVYFTARNVFDNKGAITGLLAALVLAIYPKVVMYNRLGISYNLLAPLVVVHFWGMCKYWQSKKSSWMLLAAGAIGVGSLIDLVAFTLVPGFVLLVLFIKKRDWWLGLPFIALPFIVYSASVFFSSPQVFLSDLQFALYRVSGASIFEQFIAIILNFGELLIQDGWFLLGIAGLFLIKPVQISWISLIIFLPPALIIARMSYFKIGYYYLLPWIPILSIGLGRLIELGVTQITQTIQPKVEDLIEKARVFGANAKTVSVKPFLFAIIPSLLIFLLVISPMFVSVYILNNQISDQTSHQIFNYFDNIQDAQVVQKYINAHIGSDDLVLASPALAWMLDGHVSDYQIAMAADGIPTVHFPPIPVNRLAYEVSFQAARYVVVDAIWLEWGEGEMPGLVDLRTNLEDTWWLALEVGKFRVYENPNF